MYESLSAQICAGTTAAFDAFSASGVIGDATLCFRGNEFDLLARCVMTTWFCAETDSWTITSDARASRTLGRVGCGKGVGDTHNDTGGCAP
jgi:hypothetical protein